MRRYSFFATATIILSIFTPACDKSIEPETAEFVAVQLPGCRGQLGKGTRSDSCFSYQFHDDLIVDFCAAANCCPDSNRFSFRRRVSQDTIVVTVADTAAHLCRCNCTYLLHTEFHNLERDSYQFICMREDYSSQVVLYSTRVHRD